MKQSLKEVWNMTKQSAMECLILDKYTISHIIVGIELYILIYMSTVLVFGRVDSPVMAFIATIIASLASASLHRQDDELRQFQDFLVERIQTAKVISLEELENL